MIDFNNEYYKQLCKSTLEEYTYMSYNEFLTRYNESHRYFHTIKHLEYILNYLEQQEILYINDIIVLTTIFHDIVYYPHLSNNEKQSIKLFKKYYKYSADVEVMDEVITCILDTKERKNKTDYCVIFNEADMAILYDSNRINVLKYEQDIIAEYSFLGYEEYKKQRINFLDSVKDDLNKYNIELLISTINDKDLFNSSSLLKTRDDTINNINDL